MVCIASNCIRSRRVRRRQRWIFSGLGSSSAHASAFFARFWLLIKADRRSFTPSAVQDNPFRVRSIRATVRRRCARPGLRASSCANSESLLVASALLTACQGDDSSPSANFRATTTATWASRSVESPLARRSRLRSTASRPSMKSVASASSDRKRRIALRASWIDSQASSRSSSARRIAWHSCNARASMSSPSFVAAAGMIGFRGQGR